MKYSVCFLVVLCIFLDLFDYRIALVLSAIIFVIAIEIIRYYDRVALLKKFGTETQNIHVVGLPIGVHSSSFDIDDYLLELIVFVEHSETQNEVKYRKRMLLESGNSLYKHYDKNPFSEKRFIQVKRYNHKEHQYFNESLIEYQDRFIDDIKKEGKLHNKALYLYKPDYYDKFSLRLDGIDNVL